MMKLKLDERETTRASQDGGHINEEKQDDRSKLSANRDDECSLRLYAFEIVAKHTDQLDVP